MAAKRKTGRNYGTIKKKMSEKTGAKKAAVKKASAPKQQPEASTEVDTVKPTAAASAAAQPKSEEEMQAFLERIDAPSLHDDDIAATFDHLNSVVAFVEPLANLVPPRKEAFRASVTRKLSEIRW